MLPDIAQEPEIYATDKYRATVVFLPQEGKYLVRRYVRYDYFGKWIKRRQVFVSTLLDARIAAYLHIVRA